MNKSTKLSILIECLIANILFIQIGSAQMPEVDANEITRIGDLVTVIDKFGNMDEVSDLYVMAMATPEDDNDRWYVTIFVKNGCQYCKRLLEDFHKPPLAALINETKGQDGKIYKPWAHINVYNIEDGSQKWRISAYRIPSVPTIVIQPPRSGKFGDPRNVVWQQSGYDGNANKLMQKIQEGVRNYLTLISMREKLPASKNKVGVNYSFPFLVNLVSYSQEEDIGNPPFPIINPNDQIVMQPQIIEWPPKPNQNQQQNQNQDQNQPQVSLSYLIVLLIQAIFQFLSSTGFGNLLLLIMVIYWTLERLAPMTPNKIDDKIVAVLKEAIEKKDRSGQS